MIPKKACLSPVITLDTSLKKCEKFESYGFATFLMYDLCCIFLEGSLKILFLSPFGKIVQRTEKSYFNSVCEIVPVVHKNYIGYTKLKNSANSANSTI